MPLEDPLENRKISSILIVCPHLSLEGGVSNYINLLRKYSSLDLDYFNVGAKKNSENGIEKLKNLIFDFIKFNNYLKKNRQRYCVVHFNPSFNYLSIIRDGMLLLIAHKNGIKVLTFIHGWNTRFEKFVKKFFQRLFKNIYGRTDAFIVLSHEFKEKLEQCGFTQPIYCETTIVDNELIKNYSIADRINRINAVKDIKLLFLSRIEKHKGIVETIHVLKILTKKYSSIRLVVAGDGGYLGEAKRLSRQLNLTNSIEFWGFVSGGKKISAFRDTDIYVFPTYYGEGMPTTVLEAMAFGLPVITSPIGGIKDFFVNGKHGYLIENRDLHTIVNCIDILISDIFLRKQISEYVHKYAIRNFLGPQVIRRISQIYYSVQKLK